MQKDRQTERQTDRQKTDTKINNVDTNVCTMKQATSPFLYDLTAGTANPADLLKTLKSS